MRVLFEKPDLHAFKGMRVVDMHFHTRHSHDSSTPVPAIIERARKLGVRVAITDHNSINGVLEAERLAPGFVLPGIEITTKENKDVLAYFPTAGELELFFRAHVQAHIKHKSSLRGIKTALSMERLLRELAKTRALVVLAHPFAVRPRQSYRLFSNGGAHLLAHVHAFECVNQAISHRRNLLAIGWAAQHEKPLVGGSDGHIPAMLGSAFTCAHAKDWPEFLDRIRKGDAIVVGERKLLHHHIVNMARILKEKAKVLQNRRIRNEG